VSRITVLVAATSPDIIAAGIAAGVAASTDMTLAQGRVVTLGEVGALLEAASPSTPIRLLRLSKNLPHDWKEQRRFLGFAA
jgi:hypothetical protein